ncbi:MAG: indole-3-glycerol phosphate synthase TrpC [Ferruginibacter sp.]
MQISILDAIIKSKKAEVAGRKKSMPVSKLLSASLMNRPCISLIESLEDKKGTGIIAEFKRKSPSKGYINEKADVLEVTSAYEKYGASGLSILTDKDFFGGSEKDINKARQSNLPILRKDFIIDDYQVIESKAMGADVILLIAACLTKMDVERLTALAAELKLEVLLEIHEEQEIGHIHPGIRMVGINNRNLKTFEVDIEHSIKIAAKIPGNCIKIAESGISNTATIRQLQENGFSGFLIGETFMKEANPGDAFANFVENLKNG